MINYISSLSKRLLPYSLAILAFTIPVYYKYLPLVIVICFLFWILSGNWREIKRLKDAPLPVLFLMLYWVFSVVSILYSENKDRAIADVVQKLSLFILPLIFVTSAESILGKKKVIINSYLLGLGVISVFLIIRAFYRSIIIAPYGLIFHSVPLDCPWENFFLYTRFTQPLHPTYFALYLSLGIVLIGDFIKNSNSIIKRILLFLIITFFIVLIYLSSSKAGIITGFFAFSVILFWILKYRGKVFAGIVIGIVLIIVIFFSIKNNRIYESINYILNRNNQELTPDQQRLDAKLNYERAIRIQIWKSIPELVVSNWLFGVGVGDSKDELLKTYKKRELKFAYDEQLNAHSQFFESLISLGFIGLIMLLLMFVTSFMQLLKMRDFVFGLFLAIVFLNFTFESMFERLFGVVFFTFFLLMFLLNKKKKGSSSLLFQVIHYVFSSHKAKKTL